MAGWAGFLLAEDLRWSSWSFEPTALAGIALAAGLYVGAWNRQRQAERAREELAAALEAGSPTLDHPGGDVPDEKPVATPAEGEPPTF